MIQDGPRILASSFWDSRQAQAGYYHLWPNAGAIRLLVPNERLDDVQSMQAAELVVVSRGPWPARNLAEALELMFDDQSKKPFALLLLPGQCEEMPKPGRWQFAAWKAGPVLLFERPAVVQHVERLPSLCRA
jgi:hypothetical protein